MSVEKLSDDLGVGVKGQSSWEIARTPRNAFRGSLARCAAEVEILDGRGGFAACRPQPNSECRRVERGSEGAGANVRAREGKNPDHRPRPPRDA